MVRANPNPRNMSGLENISFDGRLFPIRKDVFISGYGFRTIAGENLEKTLLKDGEYVSEKARELDEKIFFYVKDSWVATLDDRDLGSRILHLL